MNPSPGFYAPSDWSSHHITWYFQNCRTFERSSRSSLLFFPLKFTGIVNCEWHYAQVYFRSRNLVLTAYMISSSSFFFFFFHFKVFRMRLLLKFSMIVARDVIHEIFIHTYFKINYLLYWNFRSIEVNLWILVLYFEIDRTYLLDRP